MKFNLNVDSATDGIRTHRIRQVTAAPALPEFPL